LPRVDLSVPLGDLLPDRDKAFLEHGVVDRLLVAIQRIAVELAVMLQVDDQLEVALERLVERKVNALEERFIDRIRRIRRRMVGPAHRQADRVETRFLGANEEILVEMQAPIALGRRLENVTEAYPATETGRCAPRHLQPRSEPAEAGQQTDDCNRECDDTRTRQGLR